MELMGVPPTGFGPPVHFYTARYRLASVGTCLRPSSTVHPDDLFDMVKSKIM